MSSAGDFQYIQAALDDSTPSRASRATGAKGKLKSGTDGDERTPSTAARINSHNTRHRCLKH